MVLCTPRGYKIDVENNHEPMQTLSEVMEFFLDTSGRKTALPMKCNDLTILGINDPADNDYNRRIVTIKQDADSGEEMVDTGTNEMYCLPTEKGPPDVIAPPPPHVNKKEIKQQTINDPHDRWNMRSISVPNINHEGVEQVQSARFPQAPITSSGPQNSPGMRTIIDAKLEGLHDQSRRTSNIPPLGPPSSQVATPPLPPNHPSLFKKTHSQSAMISSQDNIPANVKRTVPKHTKSVSSVDVQVRKTSPRDQHSTSQARDELSQISRINKQKEMPDGTLKLKGNVIRSELEEEEKILSPVSSDSFKKELGGILENQIKQGPGQRLKTRNTSPPRDYDPFAHYKNANEIYNARK
uniref:Uncharacterized protein n=1 Tax=Arion vulgaris TaxID=1028688 RepID=A0A0B7AFB1_9EUPU